MAKNNGTLAQPAVTAVVPGSGPRGEITTTLGCTSPPVGSGRTLLGQWLDVDIPEFNKEAILKSYDQAVADFIMFYTPQISNLATTFDLSPTGSFVSTSGTA